MSALLEQYKQHAERPHGQALSLPFGAYTQSEALALEHERVFKQDWIFVCSELELPNAGDYFALTLADEPIVILRGSDGVVRALSNVCRHRGTPILDDGFGHINKYMTCPYHAWAYNHEGELAAIPYNNVIAVDKGAHQLHHFHLQSWHSLLFVHCGTPECTLEEKLQGLDEYVTPFDLDNFDKGRPGESEHWSCNWKLAMENAMESYHLFKVHESTLETITPTKQAYYLAGCSEWAVTGGASSASQGFVANLLLDKNNPTHSHYLLISLPPSFVGILSYGTFGWLSAYPTSASHTLIRPGTIGRAKYLKESRSGTSFTKAFFAEDQYICERVQKGMRASHGQGGPLVDMERVVVNFHQYLSSRLFNSQPSEFYEDPQGLEIWG
ncbi:MAG: aromatic ring-hydroxylating dioxygenase subunit alpha [Pseudomonadota bacterium]